MVNGKPGDHPLTDMFTHGMRLFPEDMDRLVRQIGAIDSNQLLPLLTEFGKWERGEDLDAGREVLRNLLARLQREQTDA